MKNAARRIVLLDSIEDEDADRSWYALADAAADAMATLADPGDQRAERMAAFHRLATETERAGDTDLAYDIAACAIELGPPPGAARETVAAYALKLGIAARRMHQVAVCAVDIALCRIAVVGPDPASRLAAFDACETAVERIGQAEEPVRSCSGAQ